MSQARYSWAQGPPPSQWFTLVVAILLAVITFYRCHRRAEKLRSKFPPNEWSSTSSLRVCTYISAYMDHYDDPGFSILRISFKAMFFLSILQMDYQKGFLIMMILLVVLESSLDCIRVLLAYRNCKSVIADDGEALLDDTENNNNNSKAEPEPAPQQLEPTNVYEDLTRPQSIAILVFVTQVMLIGLVMADSYATTTRSCFNGKDGCIMLTSLGSYILYILGTFMMCVFYVGPGNSYGKKELNSTYWLKLFLLTKGSSSDKSNKSKSVIFSYTHGNCAQSPVNTISVSRDEIRIWTRFFMSYVVNSVGFLFLMHVLPVQVANTNSIMGVVFKAVGMLYLVDLDDTAGNIMTVVTTTTPNSGGTTAATPGSNDYGSNNGDSLQVTNGNDSNNTQQQQFEVEKQQIIQQAMQDVEVKLQVLARRSGTYSSNNNVSTSTNSPFFMTVFNRQKKGETYSRYHDKNATDEETPLV